MAAGDKEGALNNPPSSSGSKALAGSHTAQRQVKVHSMFLFKCSQCFSNVFTPGLQSLEVVFCENHNCSVSLIRAGTWQKLWEETN